MREMQSTVFFTTLSFLSLSLVYAPSTYAYGYEFVLYCEGRERRGEKEEEKRGVRIVLYLRTWRAGSEC